MYLCRKKPTKNDLFCQQLLYWYAETVSKCLWLNEAKLLKFVTACLQKIDIIDRGLFSLCDLRLFLPAYDQRKWVKLVTANFQDCFGPKSARSL